MTQKEINDGIKFFQKNYVEEKSKLFIGKNFLDVLDDIAKTESAIYVQRGNVTFVKIEIERDRVRQNVITFPVKDKKRYKDFNAPIKKISLTTIITENKELLDDNQTIGSVYGLCFILDDTEELIIEEKSK